MAQVVQCLLCKHEALNSNSSLAKKPNQTNTKQEMTKNIFGKLNKILQTTAIHKQLEQFHTVRTKRTSIDPKFSKPL
jgi:hypothetical protein